MIIPRLRSDIDVIPTQYQGERVLVVKDSLGLIKQPVLLRGEDLEFIRLLDGKNTIQDIQLFLVRQKGGLLVGSEMVRSIVDRFDGLFLLDSENYRQAKKRIVENFSKQSIRPAYLAGRAYPESGDALRSYLDSILEQEPGGEFPFEKESFKALIAPHIDPEIGKEIYSRAYRILHRSRPQKIFLFGTGHSLQGSFISLTEKDFDTPLGLVQTDSEAVRRLQKSAGQVADPSDFAHRSEHSLEFQVLFLRHLLGKEFVCVPILFGSFQDILKTYSRPTEIPGMKAFLYELKVLVGEASSSALCVAGVDFSHIGPKFGHSVHSAVLIQDAKNHDENLIDHICTGDVKKFWAEIRKVEGYYNVCGFSALSCLLEVLPQTKGQLLGYDFWEEESTQSAVSYAAIALRA
ncbi:MAG: AmmeMemoRadiSam system protein B [Candidatus Aminicenantes bacterium]|jgi:AmmeMemoRadiSam system protein B